jgi:alpha-acetolactate decarboxylase
MYLKYHVDIIREAFHANEHKEFKKLNGDEMTPYATITRFEADQIDMFDLLQNE